jgi:hypothetical protein
MNPTKPIGFFTIALLLFVSLGKDCKGEYETEARNNLDGMGIAKAYTDPRSFKYVTAKGAKVESVVAVPPAALEAIDRGLQRRIDRFRIMFPAWTAATNVAGTRVFLIHPNRLMAPPGDTTIYPICKLESIPGAPCFYTNGIKTAGTVLGMDDYLDAIDLDPPLVLPHQAPTWEWLDYLAAATHNEDEHRSGWLNRRNDPTGVFYNFIGVNDVHPWQWGEPVPYLTKEPQQDFPSHCLPTPKDVEKFMQELKRAGYDVH